MVCRTSAPGKVVLCGEYAVLAGAPAVVTAIDRRARVELRPGNADRSRVRILSDEQRELSFHFDTDGRIDWNAAEPVKLLDSVFGELGPPAAENLELVLDTREFFDVRSGLKYGFGSSAALCSALVQSLCRATEDPQSFAEHAMRAHRDFQGGKGSGVDVAASVHGGLIEYSLERDAGTRRLQWPDGLEYAVIWSGKAASTSDQLDKLGPIVRDDPGTRALINESRFAAAEWTSGNAVRVLDSMRRYVPVLRQFDDALGLGIYDGGHDELHNMACAEDILYKPCGAGGGDIGAALATDADALADFCKIAGEAGYRLLDVQLESRGAALDDGYKDD